MALPPGLNFLNDKILGVKTWVLLALVMTVGGIGSWWMVSQPAYATWRYGMCKIFLEQYVRFPITINIEQGGETRGSAFISFSDINPFGSQTVRNFECHFSQDARGTTTLSKITLDRKTIPEDRLKFFQQQMPVLSAQELDTALPKELPSKLENYKD